ncbi:MAG: glycosyltransferase family protein [Thermodesulfobacteriota bacterium]
MNFLVVGGFFLSEALQLLGHKVIHAEAFGAPDTWEVDLAAVLEQLPAGDRPDLVLVGERLGPRRLPLNLEHIQVPRAFYALDPHLNLYWHQKYAGAFDLVFTTQQTSMSALEGRGRRVYWLPWAVNLAMISDHLLPRTHQIAFVGRVDARLRRKRHLILEALKSRFPVSLWGNRPDNQVHQQELGRIYSQARVVVNESIQGEVNLRVFEALAAGALLLTEDVGPNLLGLFTPGKHLVTYSSQDLLDKAAYFLSHEEERRDIAEKGRERVYARHHTLARARQFLEYLGEPEWSQLAPDHLQLGQTLLHLSFRGLYPVRLGLERARFHLSAALRRDPDCAPAYLALGQLSLMARDIPGALAAYDRALALTPGDFHLHILRGHLWQHQGKIEAAAQAFRQGLKHARGISFEWRRRLRSLLPRGMGAAPFFAVLGQVYEAQGLTLEPGYPPAPDPRFFGYAVEYYLYALKLDPHYVPALKSLGRLLERHGLPCEAIPYLEKWRQLEPENPEARWLLGRVQLQGYQPREGLKNLLVAQVLEPQRDLMEALRGVPLDSAVLQTLLPQITPEELWSCQALPC